MKHSFIKGLSIATLLSVFSSGSAIAMDRKPGFYLGGAIGQVDVSSYNDSDTGLAAFAGFRFNRNFAIEGGYADLGKVETERACPETCIPELPGTYRASADRLEVAIVAGIPVSEYLELYAKAGYARAKIDTVAIGTTGTRRFSDNESSPIFGAGIRINFDSPWAIRLQWDRHDTDGGNIDGI